MYKSLLSKKRYYFSEKPVCVELDEVIGGKVWLLLSVQKEFESADLRVEFFDHKGRVYTDHGLVIERSPYVKNRVKEILKCPEDCDFIRSIYSINSSLTSISYEPYDDDDQFEKWLVENHPVKKVYGK